MALIAVVGAMAVVAIIAVTVLSATVVSVGYTSSSKALNQSQAAADSAIDYAHVLFKDSDFKCTVPDLPGFDYDATVEYFDGTGAALGCGTVVAGSPASAVVTSTGYASAKGIGGVSNGDAFTRIATFEIVIVANPYFLNKGVFNDSGTTVANNTNLVGSFSDVYTNGAFNCESGSLVKGNLYVQGTISVTNNCVVEGNAWTASNIDVATQVTFKKDLYSVGTISLTNGSWVSGSVVANGNITLDSNGNNVCSASGTKAKICGSVISLGGNINVGDVVIGGGAYAKGSVALGTVNNKQVIGANVVAGTGPVTASSVNTTAVGGWVATGGQINIASGNAKSAWVGNGVSTCAASAVGTDKTYPLCNPNPPVIPVSAVPASLNYPTNPLVVAPPRESLPRINMASAGLATRWAGWNVVSAGCEADINAQIAAQAAGTKMLLVSTCTSAITWNSQNLVLKGDVAIMSPNGYSVSNNSTFSSSTSTIRDFMLIVPSDSPGVTWTNPIATDPAYSRPTCASEATGKIKVVTQTTFANLRTFLYTPCIMDLDNQVNNFAGQIYAGVLQDLPNNSALALTQMTVPGVESATAPSTDVEVTQTARFDKRG